MDPKETNTNEYREFGEAEEFLMEYLPSEKPTLEEYLYAYGRIDALRNSTHPHRQQEHQELALVIESQLPYTKKGFDLITAQIYYETVSGIPEEDSLIDPVIFSNPEDWLGGTPGFNLWRVLDREMNEDEVASLSGMLRILKTFSDELEKQFFADHERERRRIAEQEKVSTFRKIGKALPEGVKKSAQKVGEFIVSGTESREEELHSLAIRMSNVTKYMQNIGRIFRNDWVLEERDVAFWFSRNGEILLNNLLVSEEYREKYYEILDSLAKYAEEKNDYDMLGSIGTNHALRIARLPASGRDFKNIQYWSGIWKPKSEGDGGDRLIRVRDGKEIGGYEVLKKLLSTGDKRDAKIYATTMRSFIEYLSKSRRHIDNYEIPLNFFKTQYSFDRIFNLPESEREVFGKENSFDYILNRYLWFKYGPECGDKNPTPFEVALWKLQRDILMKGIGVYEKLIKIFYKGGDKEYELNRDFYRDARDELQREYSDSAWDLIMYVIKHPEMLKVAFDEAFSKYNITFEDQEDDFLHLAILIGTLDYSLAIKHKENLKKVSAGAKRYLYDSKIPEQMEEMTEDVAEKLKSWRFQLEEEEPGVEKIVFNNNILNSLKNLSIFWGRGHGVSVFIEQGGILIKNPLHTMGQEKEVTKNGVKSKERMFGGGRDEVLIPWEIIAKATPQFDYIPWGDALNRLAGKYRAITGRKDADFLSNIATWGPAVVRFEAAGSERMYELPPLPRAKEIAALLQKIAKQIVTYEPPHPKKILTEIS